MNLVSYELNRYSIDAVKMHYMLCIQFNSQILLGCGEYNLKCSNQVYSFLLNNKVSYV